MNADNEPQQTEGARTGGTKRGRLIFLGIALVVAVVLFRVVQRGTPDLPGWDEDLQAALQRGPTENRPIIVFFMNSPSPTEAGRTLMKVALSKKQNKKAMNDGKYLRVRVKMDRGARKKWSERFNITKLPTLLILAPNGEELNRRTGNVGEVPFRSEFLSCRVVQKP